MDYQCVVMNNLKVLTVFEGRMPVTTVSRQTAQKNVKTQLEWNKFWSVTLRDEHMMRIICVYVTNYLHFFTMFLTP
jgi:hypothetical protein